MNRVVRLVSPLLLVAGVSCSSSGSKSAPPAQSPAPAPAPAATAQGGRGAAPTQGAQGQAAPGQAAAAGQAAPGGAGRAGGPPRPQLTPEQRAVRRDSIAALRAQTVKEVLESIAGHENEPAGTVFKNVVLLKDMPAGEFLKEMDQDFGVALSQNCTSCHVAGQWDDDSRNGKKRARIMIEMVAAINKDHLSKLPPGRSGGTPTVNCITCHRGVGGNPGRAIVP